MAECIYIDIKNSNTGAAIAREFVQLACVPSGVTRLLTVGPTVPLCQLHADSWPRTEMTSDSHINPRNKMPQNVNVHV